MTRLTPVEIIRQAATEALKAADKLVPEWLPEGKPRKREWVACNPVRGDRHAGSFGVSLDTGRWHDFADSSAHGGDLVSLLSYLRGCGQFDAAREIDERLHLGLFNRTAHDSEAIRQRQQRAEQERQLLQEEAVRTQEQRQEAAAQHAAKLWAMARPADPDHVYLQRKRVQPYGLRQLTQGRLLVPLLYRQRLVNLQIISPNGDKRFLADGRVQGCYSPLGKLTPGGRLYACEGWATGATLHAATGSPVVCAMNATNLTHVAREVRERYGERVELVIAGDDDRRRSGNPGRVAANYAADVVGALVVFPEWPAGAPMELSDFNDLHVWQLARNAQRSAQ